MDIGCENRPDVSHETGRENGRKLAFVLLHIASSKDAIKLK